MSSSFDFYGYGLLDGVFYSNNVYSTETLLPGELRLRMPFPTPILEKYRQICMGNSSNAGQYAAMGRAVIIFTRITDVQAIFANLLGAIYTGLDTGLNGRTRTIDMDQTVSVLYPLAGSAMQELATYYSTPKQFQDLLTTRLAATSFSNRVSAACATVFLTAILQTEKDGSIP